MNPYQPPSQFGAAPYGAAYQGQSAAAPLFESARGMTGVTVVFLGIVASWGLLIRGFWIVAGTAIAGSSRMLMTQVTGGVESLLHLVAFICFAIWLYRYTAAMRQQQGQTRYTPGMAVGGWFIPFANFAMPYLSLRDLWDRTPDRGQAPTGGAIVGLWWASYWLFSIVNAAVKLAPQLHLVTDPTVFASLGWLTTVLRITTYGSWLFIVKTLSERSRQL